MNGKYKHFFFFSHLVAFQDTQIYFGWYLSILSSSSFPLDFLLYSYPAISVLFPAIAPWTWRHGHRYLKLILGGQQ